MIIEHIKEEQMIAEKLFEIRKKKEYKMWNKDKKWIKLFNIISNKT